MKVYEEKTIVKFNCSECGMTWLVEADAPVIVMEDGCIGAGVLVAYKCDNCGTEIRRSNEEERSGA